MTKIIFWTNNFYGLKIIFDQKLFGAKNILEQKFFWNRNFFVKLQSKLNSPVQVGQGIDFVFPLSQQQQQQQEEEQQEEPSPKSTSTKCATDMEFGTKT